MHCAPHPPKTLPGAPIPSPKPHGAARPLKPYPVLQGALQRAAHDRHERAANAAAAEVPPARQATAGVRRLPHTRRCTKQHQPGRPRSPSVPCQLFMHVKAAHASRLSWVNSACIPSGTDST